MKELRVIYISLSGNTASFVKRLSEHMALWHDVTIKATNVYNLVKNDLAFAVEHEPFVIFLPTYLEGGDGVDTGTTEVLTTPLRDYMGYQNNYKQCLGVIGSGNRNFNEQYCLTAKQYSEQFSFPVLDTFELRGTQKDIERIADKLVSLMNK